VYADESSRDYANELGLRYFGTPSTHNWVSGVAADLGVIGLSAGLAMIGVTLVQLARLRRYRRWRRPSYAALGSAYWLAGTYAAAAMFLRLPYVRYFLALPAVANPLIWIPDGEQPILEPVDQRRPSQGHLLRQSVRRALVRLA
jgi:hypothetical protein